MKTQINKLLKNKMALAVIAVLVLVFFIYRTGKKAGESEAETVDQAPFIGSGDSIPQGWTPTPLAERLYDTMSGVNFWQTNDREAAWRSLIDMPSDDMIIAVYNEFNRLHQKKEGETLTQFIANETPPLKSSQQQVLDLQRQLNLT